MNMPRKLKPRSILLAILPCSLLMSSPAVLAANGPEVPRRFVASLYKLHQHITGKVKTRTESRVGGYGGLTGNTRFYKEIRYYDRLTDRMLSKIQWERKNPDNIHTIEVFIKDADGRPVREYAAAYLPNKRNAPHQTLISIYRYNGGVSAYRQFDAYGEVLFEQCSGKVSGKPFRIVFDYHEIPEDPANIPDKTERLAYPVCFGKMPSSPGKYLDPLAEIKK